MGAVTRGGLLERMRRMPAVAADRETLARTVYAAVARHVPYDFACFATTDPSTGLITWASKTRDLGVGDEEFAATEYGEPDLNAFTEIAARRPPVGVLSVDTDGHPERCRRHREFMAPRFGFTDELRVAFVDRGATWAALALYRGPGDPPFTATEGEQLGSVAIVGAEAVLRCLVRTDREVVHAADDPGPAVLVVDPTDQVAHLTPAAEAVIDELGGRDHGALPANLLAVVASTRGRAAPGQSRALGAAGRWLSLRSAPLSGPGGDGHVVVTVEPTSRAELGRLALAAHGLTAREEEVALLVLQGADTRTIAATLHLSPHTVQDHLKVVFAKLGVSSRREMTARLVL